MEILVLLKRVPDTETRVKIAPDGRALDASGVQWITAPYDEIAVEKAIRLKEASGGTVTALTLGPPEATKELRTALAMGADAAIHLETTEEHDALATAKAIRAALGDRAYDLILCGKQATDSDDAAVGPMLAALLDLPCVAFAEGLEVQDGRLRVRREVEGETEVIEVEPPCVVTAQKGLAEPRYPGLKGIMAAKKKPLESHEATSVPSLTRTVSLALPAPRGRVTLLDATPEGARALLRVLREERKVL